MGTALLDTNLNQFPYWDDFDANDQFYRVLHKPVVAVQSRELNAVQSILQNQVTGVAQNIFVNGTIVSGVNMTFNASLGYVKLVDTYANGAALTVSDLNGLYALSNTGLKALINETQPGYVAQAPNLNTLFVSYLNSATTNSAIKVFQNDEVLSIVTSANVLIGKVQVANVSSSGANSNTTGLSYAMSVSSGTIFQKGLILNVEPQTIVISPYSNQPTGVSVGFECVESVINSYQDPSLLDNSQGSSNYAAPGADRLKIVPTLTIRSSNSVSTNTFFSIVDFVGGAPSIVNSDTQYATIGAKMAQISYETNGNFVVNPFNVRTLTNYQTSGAVDPYNIKLEVDAGLAYIQGYRVQVVGKLLSALSKGLAVQTSPAQIVTTQIGNYLQVQELAGVFNPGALQQVSLRNAPAYAISNNLSIGIPANNIAAPGVEIGKANIIAVEYDNGTQGLNNCVYDVYIFNIQMNSGYSFSSVRSLYANNGGQLGFADLVLQSGAVTLNDTSVSTLVYSFNQAAIKTLTTSSNTVDTQFQYLSSANVNFSNTGTVTVSIPTYAGGTNELPFGTGALTTPQKEGFLITSEGNVTTSNIAGSITTSGNTVTGLATNFTAALYPGCYISIANSTVSEIKQVASITNSTSLALTRNATNNWTSANVAIQYLSGMEIPTSSSNVGITVGSANTFTIALNQNFTSAFNATVLYPIQRVIASPAKKRLQTSVYVCINLANNAGGVKGPWNLGIPDVFAVANVWVGATYSNTNPSITNQFTLHNGQNDYYYGLGYLTSNGASLNTSQVLLVQLKAFTPDYSQGAGFFSVDSYPIDDTGVAANTIFTADIPTYTSIANSSLFNLRNSVDFRFYAQNTIPYISNAALAVSNTSIVNPSNTLTFNTSGGVMIPVNGAEFESSIQYYLGRYDVVGLDIHGNIVVNTGVPSENPVSPGGIQSGMTLATIYIPPYPSLTNDNADRFASAANPRSTLTYNTNRRYTMQDVGGLDQRITQATYYSALSTLEQSAQNLMLTNTTGNNVFQNGILSDPFNDFSISNTLDPEFNIAIDGANSVARPTFTQFLVNLNYSNSLSYNINESVNDRLVTLGYTQEVYLQQPFASQVRNCSQDTLYTWNGTVTLTPEGDFMPDVTVNPAVVVSLDSYSNWVNLANAWGTQWGTWNETGSSTTNSTAKTKSSNSTATTTTKTTTATTTTTATQNGTQLSVSPVNSTYNFGNVVTDVSLQPFCAANLIKFKATGLKPSTQVWTFFNDTPISQYCAQTDSNYNILNQTNMVTDSLGNIYGYFYLPANTFYSGFINFQILDISNLATQTNLITSLASCTYNGTNLAYTVNNLELQTTTAQLAVTTVSQSMTTVTNTVTSTSTVTINNPPKTIIANTPGNNSPNPAPPPPAPPALPNTVPCVSPFVYIAPAVTGHYDGSIATSQLSISSNVAANGDFVLNNGPILSMLGIDPLAQGFSIFSSTLPAGIQGVYVTSLDLFFNTVDPSLGVTVQIRDMVNGYPGITIQPGSSVHLTPSQMNTSPNASVATNVLFPNPVFLQNGVDYCFVIIPDGGNPSYTLWTAVISGKDVLTNAPIYSLSSIGDMFLSSQNTTWTPYQNEAVKFNINIANFTYNTGIATFTNDDSEYLSIVSPSRVFQLGEPVYYSNNILRSSNVSVSNTSNTVTANTTGLLAGSKIYLFSNTNNSTMVANVVSVSTGTFVINTIPTFTDANCSMGLLTSNGGLSGVIQAVNNSVVTVGNSTANSSVYLTVNNGIIIGSRSLASATISALNDIPYDTIMPKFSTSVPSACALLLSMIGTANASIGYTTDANYTALPSGFSTDFIDQERVVMSKSNEMRYKGGTKSMQVYGSMTTVSGFLSPAIDTIKSGMVCIQNLINGEDANNDVFVSEITNQGNAINKYVSDTITLVSGMEAENLTVYLSAYWPADTSIYVYGKIQNQYDSDPFSAKAWTPMYTNNVTRSSAINKEDYNQYIYTFPNTLPSGTAFLNTAHLDASNNYVASYTSNSGALFETFNVFAIKIVLLSNAGSYLVPMLSDFVAIASASTV